MNRRASEQEQAQRIGAAPARLLGPWDAFDQLFPDAPIVRVDAATVIGAYSSDAPDHFIPTIGEWAKGLRLLADSFRVEAAKCTEDEAWLRDICEASARYCEANAEAMGVTPPAEPPTSTRSRAPKNS